MPSVRQRSERPTTSDARVACGVEHAVLARGHEHRLGDDSDDLLDEQRRAGQEPAGVAPAERGIRLGADEPERRPERRPASHAASSIADQSCSTPPNGVTTGPSPTPPLADQHGDVARRALENAVEISGRGGRSRGARATPRRDEVDVVLGREPHRVGAGLGRGVRGDAGRRRRARRDRAGARRAPASRPPGRRRRSSSRARMSSRAGRRASGSAIASRSSSRSASPATTMIARCRGARQRPGGPVRGPGGGSPARAPGAPGSARSRARPRAARRVCR